MLQAWTLRWVFEVCRDQAADSASISDWTVEYFFVGDGELLMWTWGRNLNELLEIDAFSPLDWATLRLRRAKSR
jgi:hypothetical protein